MPSSPSDYFVGVICGVDIDNRIIRVRFKLSEHDIETGYDKKDIPFDSKGILWIAEPIKAITRSLVDVPNIEDSLGYKVEVKSTLPDAEEGDFFIGSITGFDLDKMSIFINFVSEQNEESDIEEIPYNSVDIAWTAKPTGLSVEDGEVKEDENVNLKGNIYTTVGTTLNFNLYEPESSTADFTITSSELVLNSNNYQNGNKNDS